MKKLQFAFLFGLFIILLAIPVHAQDPAVRPTPTNVPIVGAQGAQNGGSIRGTIYNDTNGDGKCSGTNEPVLTGVPIEFISNDGQTVLYLQSGSDGTYGLVAAGFGTWQVSAKPPANYAVTSAKTLSVFISEEQQLSLGNDFCLRQASGSTINPAPVVLPESGAPAAPVLWLAAIVGLFLMGVGVLLQIRGRFSH